MLIALKLARNGYGTVEQILDMPVDLVIKTHQYEIFVNQYEAAAMELNKNETR